MSMSRLIRGSCVVNWVWEKSQKCPPSHSQSLSHLLAFVLLSWWILANYLTWVFSLQLGPFPSLLPIIIPQRSGPRWTQIFEWVQMKMSGNYCSSCRAGLQSHDTKLRQQFAAVSCCSRSLCRPLLQFNWIGSGPRKDKANKVTSRHSKTLDIGKNIIRDLNCMD